MALEQLILPTGTNTECTIVGKPNFGGTTKWLIQLKY